MEGLCPTPGPDDPLVRGLLLTVDCNVQTLVRSGYGALFEPSSPFAVVLTTLLTVFVALFGYQLLLGRAQLRVGDLALTLVKLGAVLALTTQWAAYQSLVYQFLFNGPTQLANVMVGAVRPGEAGSVFDGLQSTFDALTGFAALYGKATPASVSALIGGSGSGALALNASAALLLLSSLGVLLAAKIVLGVLLAVGPVFIALLLFDSTRGLFLGWLRAALAFAFAPLAATLLLGIALVMLQPSLLQVQDLTTRGDFATLGPVYSVLTLVMVFAAVSAGMIVAGGVIAGGLKLPEARPAPAGDIPAAAAATPTAIAEPTRAGQIAAAVGAQDRRDITLTGGAAGARALTGPATVVADPGAAVAGDRRAAAAAPDRVYGALPAETRLGQGPGRNVRPRAMRTSARSRR